MALCALLDTIVPEKINYRTLSSKNRNENVLTFLKAADELGISKIMVYFCTWHTLFKLKYNIVHMLMLFVTSVYRSWKNSFRKLLHGKKY